MTEFFQCNDDGAKQVADNLDNNQIFLASQKLLQCMNNSKTTSESLGFLSKVKEIEKPNVGADLTVRVQSQYVHSEILNLPGFEID
ncbi:MAG: hypothetical protein WC028_26195 [Candidatus Obscuribacterales bacterium]